MTDSMTGSMTSGMTGSITEELHLNTADVFHYLGIPEEAGLDDLRERISRWAETLNAGYFPRWVWRVFPLDQDISGPEDVPQYRLGDSTLLLSGKTADMMLQDCHAAALLACTLGPSFDSLLRNTQVRDMEEAVILDACGSAWVEAGCDGAEREVSARFPELFQTDRFSPGYGDLPLSLQREICALLDVGRRLGLTVTERSLLNPLKSVTAVIGLSHRPQRARIRGCAYCTMRETCILRGEGRDCGQSR